MNTGAKRYRTHSMPRCPGCGPIGNVIKDGITPQGKQRYKCTRCRSMVHPDEPRPVKATGNVAGKIEIGRGYRWYAGLV